MSDLYHSTASGSVRSMIATRAFQEVILRRHLCHAGGQGGERQPIVDHVGPTIGAPGEIAMPLAYCKQVALHRDIRVLPEAEPQPLPMEIGNEPIGIRERLAIPLEVGVLAPAHPPGVDMDHVARDVMLGELFHHAPDRLLIPIDTAARKP